MTKVSLNNKKFNLRFPAPVKDFYTDYAKQMGVSLNAAINMVLKNYMDYQIKIRQPEKEEFKEWVKDIMETAFRETEEKTESKKSRPIRAKK